MSQEKISLPTTERTCNSENTPPPSPSNPNYIFNQPIFPISSFPTVEESAVEQEISDEADEHEETLEEEARHEKEWEARIKEEEAHDELFRLEFELEIQDRGCRYFMWKDDLRLRLSSSPGPSTPPSSSTGPSTPLSPSRFVPNHGKLVCLNCKFLAERIKTLEAKIKILKGTLEMERHPENHTFDSTIILYELYNDMGRFGLE
ncbi:hypothetical protein Tco_1269936 [Tanacetum coccineum]